MRNLKTILATHHMDPFKDTCAACGAHRNEIEDALVAECTGPKRLKVGEAYLALQQAAIDEWDEWTNGDSEARRLRTIAERLSGLGPERLNSLCSGFYRMTPPQVCGKDGPTFVGGPFRPAWTYWLDDARLALEAVKDV